VKLTWRSFAAAATIGVAILLPHAPLRAIVVGVALAGLAAYLVNHM
jgi:hypothetical protein